jgi:hypothetical protein
MNDTISVAADAFDVDRHVHGNHSAARRRGGGWRRHVAIAAVGFAIVAPAVGISDRAEAVGPIDVGPRVVGYLKKADLGKLEGELFTA